MSVFGSNLTIVNSSFVGNKLDSSEGVGSGAAIVIKGSRTFENFLIVEGCNFTDNSDLDGDSGDPLKALTNGSPLEATQFIRFFPPTVTGGALSIEGISSATVTGSRFGRNRATPAGGAISVWDADSLEVIGCDFFDNKARATDSVDTGLSRNAQGGALYVQLRAADSSFSLEGSNFTNNSAGYGGAIHFVGHAEAKMKAEMVLFEGNRARFGGGAILLRNAISEFSSTIFQNNIGGFGGGVMLANGATLRLTGLCSREDMRFTGNVAVTGGAIAARGAGVMEVSDVAFANNHALESGGAVALVEGTITTQMTIENPIVLNNSATRGGGIFVDSIGKFSIRPSSLCPGSVNTNVAMYGGGLMIRAQSRTKNDIALNGISFIGNAAVPDLKNPKLVRRAQVDYYQSVAGADNYEALQGVIANRTAKLKVLQSQGKISLVDITIENGASGGTDMPNRGGGGGALLELGQGTTQSGVSARLQDVQFEKNFGKLGGGLMAIVDGPEWAAKCESQAAACRAFLLENVTFTQDGALSTAGGLFASDPRNVFVDEENQTLVDFFQRNDVTSPGDGPVAFFNNSVNQGGFGADSASFASHLVLKAPLLTNVTIDNRVVQLLDTGKLNHNSTDPLPNFVLEVKDSFNQTITSGTQDA
eukprot:evm.model.scf_1373.1 EVM.evm.TU.scf_1373.1   scf_1373:236-3684(-)